MQLSRISMMPSVEPTALLSHGFNGIGVDDSIELRLSTDEAKSFALAPCLVGRAIDD